MLYLTIAGKVTNLLSAQKMAERSEAKSAKQSFASKVVIRIFLTGSIASLRIQADKIQADKSPSLQK